MRSGIDGQMKLRLASDKLVFLCTICVTAPYGIFYLLFIGTHQILFFDLLLFIYFFL
jgi:hypothetical protein